MKVDLLQSPSVLIWLQGRIHLNKSCPEIYGKYSILKVSIIDGSNGEGLEVLV